MKCAIDFVKCAISFAKWAIDFVKCAIGFAKWATDFVKCAIGFVKWAIDFVKCAKDTGKSRNPSPATYLLPFALVPAILPTWSRYSSRNSRGVRVTAIGPERTNWTTQSNSFSAR